LPRIASSAADRQLNRRDVAVAIGLFALAVALFANSLGHEFVWDDTAVIRDNPFLRERGAWWHCFGRDFGLEIIRRPVGYYRPVVFLSFLLNYAEGGLHPFAYHAANVWLHGLNTVLVFCLLGRLAGRRIGTLAAAFFASEVMYRNRPLLEKLFYSLISALTAHVMSSLVAGARPMMFGVENISTPTPGDMRYWLGVLLMGVVLAFVGQLYRILNVQFHAWFQQGIKNQFVRLLAGFGMTGAIALVVYYLTRWFGITDRGLELVLGSGESMILGAFAGQVTLSMALIGLLAKMPATLSTINSGGSAGLLVPSFFFGTMVAAAFAQFFQSEPVFFIVPALTGSLIAIVNTPFAALLFVVEEFGAGYLLPALVILIITGLLSNPKTIYRAQQVAVDSMEILPGYDIELIGVPAAWVGKTLDDLKLHDQFEVQVVGLLDRSAGDEQPSVLFGSELTAATTLVAEDTILVYGQEEELDALVAAATEL